MMTKRALLAEQLPDSAAHGAVEPEAIRLQLGRLVESPSFRSSKRCRLFLEHAIEHALTPNAVPLKEREVGMQVFGREPSYDTAADPVVRVTAGEIRRRLGQYYAEPPHQRELRVELPAGSYTPTFTWPADSPPAASVQPGTASGSGAAATGTATAASVLHAVLTLDHFRSGISERTRRPSARRSGICRRLVVAPRDRGLRRDRRGGAARHARRYAAAGDDVRSVLGAADSVESAGAAVHRKYRRLRSAGQSEARGRSRQPR